MAFTTRTENGTTALLVEDKKARRLAEKILLALERIKDLLGRKY